jgi:PAS domain S-box-containing protein
VGERFGTDLQALLDIREAQLREAMALANCGTWEWDVQAGIVTWSPELRRIIGVAADHPASVENFMALIHPQDREWAKKSMAESLVRGFNGERPFRIVRPDGGVRVVNGRGIANRHENGVVTYMVGVIQDICSEAQCPDLLREREAIETLTKRENEVLRLVVRGVTSKGVATVLGLSPKTVETYRCRLMAKLGVEDIASLVRFCIRNGLTTP